MCSTSYVREVIDRKGHCVIVVAEGAGEVSAAFSLISKCCHSIEPCPTPAQKHFEGVDLGTDASGNKKLPDIGQWLRDQGKAWLKGNIQAADPFLLCLARHHWVQSCSSIDVSIG